MDIPGVRGVGQEFDRGAEAVAAANRVNLEGDLLLAGGCIQKAHPLVAGNAERLASELNRTVLKGDSFRKTTAFSLPVATSQRRTVLSCPVVASVLPSGLNATEKT